MPRKSAIILLSCFILTACAEDKPHVVQTSADTPAVHLTEGIATQIEMPEGERVQSVVTGNPSLVVAEREDNVVNLIPGKGAGETNLIVRATDEGRRSKVYQYRLIVESR
jgi:type IV secretory pathway VirB9-like protein